ncbi:methylamine dehydrogenase accessory protein MauD [Sphingopyxis sp.]|uniref:methylamine dehydrogenase accessory protein MauD n=1 Tax=Sphingopyxis sp. TaxID=1908224 RepID=UPI003D6D13A1
MSVLVASQFLLWTAVIALGLLVIALARQIGVLHERIAPAGALTLHQKKQVGDLAPEFELPSLSGSNIKIGGSRQGKSQLIFFLSPVCPVCKSLLPVLRSVARAERRWVDTVLASDGSDELQHQNMVKTFGLSDLPYVLSEQLGRSLGVSKLPYAVLIDEEGRIASLGLINNREHLESLFEAKDRGVASIQQYLARA